MNRRTFLRAAAIAPLGIAAAQTAKKQTLKVALNAYSFNKLLNDHLKGRGEGITLTQVLEFAARNGCEGFDPTGYFFPGYPERPADSYVDALKKRAAELGVGISGTGVRNNFTTADRAVRETGVNHIQEWVEVAARLGAPVLRVFADTQMRNQSWKTVSDGHSRDDVQAWIADCLRRCAETGKKFGVRIGVQNHGDFLRTGDDVLSLIKAVGSDWCGPIVDTGYFVAEDPYAEMAKVAPKALNWQIKETPFGQESKIPTDMVKLVKLIRHSGFSGYLPVETLGPRGGEYDPFKVVPPFLKQLRDAIAQTA